GRASPDAVLGRAPGPRDVTTGDRTRPGKRLRHAHRARPGVTGRAAAPATEPYGAKTDAIATIAKAPMTTPDTMLMRPIHSGVTRVRRVPMMVVSTTHQAVEPSRTPSTMRAASPVAPLVTPRPANSAPNDRIVIGLAIVRPRIDRYAPA